MLWSSITRSAGTGGVRDEMGFTRGAGATSCCAAIVVMLICSVAVLPVSGSEESAGGWPMFQARGDHNAVFRRPNFRPIWTFEAGERINSGLAVVGDLLLFDTLGGKVVALDVRRGTVRWQSTLDNVTMSTPIVIDRNVFIGTGHNGSINSHNADFVYAAGAHSPTLRMWGRPEGDHLVAFDLNTGAKRWQYRTAGEDMPSAVAIHGVLVFANGDFNVYGLRTGDGTAVWQHPLRGLATMASANRTGDYAIVSTCSGPDYRGETFAMHWATGHVRWHAVAGDCDSAPTLDGARVFVSGVDGIKQPYGYGARGTVEALDAKSGRVLWHYISDEAGPYTKIGSNERAIAGCYHDGIYFQALPTVDKFLAFDASTGHVLWQLRTTAPVKMSAVARNGKVYFGDTAGLFYTVDEHSGKVLSIRMFDAPFTVSPPVIVGDSIFVASGTKVFAFGV